MTACGGEVPRKQSLQAHAELLRQDAWIIDGLGCLASTWDRFAAADTLVYVDLPVVIQHWWVAKRFLKGLFATAKLAGK